MPKEPTPLRIDELDVPALSAEAARFRCWLDAEDLVAASRTSSGFKFVSRTWNDSGAEATTLSSRVRIWPATGHTDRR